MGREDAAVESSEKEEAGDFQSRVIRGLVRLRMDRGWNQTQLGQAAGVAPPNISAYERGKSGLQVETLGRLLEAMDASIYDLGDAMTSSSKVSDLEARMADMEAAVSRFVSTSDDMRESLRQLERALDRGPRWPEPTRDR